MSHNSSRVLVALCAASAVAGCGLGAGSTPNEPVALSVTRDFGATSLVQTPGARVSGTATALSVLRRGAKVATGSGGKIVRSIDGLSSGPIEGRPSGWYVYVNGILGDSGGAPADVHGGDRVWWDHHDSGLASDIRAVVGAYPEPFLHGVDGKRLPVRVECVDPAAKVCGVVSDKLLALGVPIGRSNISRSAADESLRVLVGPWKMIRGRDAESDAIDSGPQASGVFARFDGAGDELSVLDERGRTARTLAAGTGLIAATRSKDRQPVWFVTGTDDAGVDAAARALDEGALSDHYALAITEDLPVALPAPATK